MEDSIQHREEKEEAESKERPDWRQQREEIRKQEMYNPRRIGWCSDLKTGTEFTNQIEYIKIFGSSKKRSERQMKTLSLLGTQSRKGREEEKSTLEITSSPCSPDLCQWPPSMWGLKVQSQASYRSANISHPPGSEPWSEIWMIREARTTMKTTHSHGKIIPKITGHKLWSLAVLTAKMFNWTFKRLFSRH